MIVNKNNVVKKEINRTNKKYRPGIKDIRKNYDLYLLLIPGLVMIVLFRYVPMYGITIAFKDFNIFEGIMKSQWVGFENFQKLFTTPEFFRIFRNTLLISCYKIIFNFPLPIIIAICLNEMRCLKLKKTIQTVIYLPHFLSWVIVAGIFSSVLSTSGGIVNSLIENFGGQPIPFLMSKQWFRSILVLTDGWKTMGWGSIIYIAAISGIDQELYEAAEMDGAGRLKKIWYITLPMLSSTIVLMLILRLGTIMVDGQEQVLMLYNPTVYETGDILTTYVYRMGIGKMDYSFSSAVGLLNSVISLFLVLSGNYISGKLTNRSIW